MSSWMGIQVFDVLVKFVNSRKKQKKEWSQIYIYFIWQNDCLQRRIRSITKFTGTLFDAFSMKNHVSFSIFEIVIIFFIRSKGMHKISQILHTQSPNNLLFCCNEKLSREMLQLEDLNNEVNRNENWGCAASITQSTVSFRNQGMMMEVKEASKLQKVSVFERKKMMNMKNHVRGQSDLCYSGGKSPSFKAIGKTAKENNEEERNIFSSDSDYFNIFQTKSKNSKKSLRLIKQNSNQNALSATIQQQKYQMNCKQTPYFPRKQQTLQQDHEYMLFLNGKNLAQPWRNKLDLGRNLPTYQSLDIQGMTSLQMIGKYQ